MKRPTSKTPHRGAKTKRLSDYLAPSQQPFSPPSFDSVKADVLRQKTRKLLWTVREIKSLYDTGQISQHDYVALLVDLEDLGKLLTDEIQDILEGCVAKRAIRKAAGSTRTQALLKMRQEQPWRSVEDIAAYVKAWRPPQ